MDPPQHQRFLLEMVVDPPDEAPPLVLEQEPFLMMLVPIPIPIPSTLLSLDIDSPLLKT